MWLVGGIYGYGYNVWVWLVGVVMRYIDILIIIINFTYSTCIRSFFGSSILTSLFIFKCFFGLSYILDGPKQIHGCSKAYNEVVRGDMSLDTYVLSRAVEKELC